MKETIGENVTNYIPDGYILETVTVCSGNGVEEIAVLIDIPMTAIKEITDHKTIIIRVKPIVEQVNNITELMQPVTAFDVLMKIRHDYLPTKRSESNSKDRLYNSILNILQESGVGFSRAEPKLSKFVINKLTGVFWYLDQFWDRFNERSCKIPDLFKGLIGYRDYKVSKKKKPILTLVDLTQNVEIIGDILLMPFLDDHKHVFFKNALSNLYDTMVNYSEIMTNQSQRTASNHRSLSPVRAVKDNWSLKSLPIRSTDQEIYSLKQVLEGSDNYQLVNLEKFLPVSSNDRKCYIENLAFPFSVTLMTYSFGNYLGNTYHIWKTSCDRKKEASAVSYVLANVPLYSTRAMRSQFLNKYCNVTKPHVLRNMWKFVTNDESAPEYESQEEIDDRVVKFFLGSDDDEIITDLRKNNGRISNPVYNVFWNKLTQVLEDKAVVHERRHSSHMYLPEWISVRDLRESILRECPTGTEAPSESWIRLNFYPANPFISTAINYHSKFKVKYQVQQRMLRSKHPDSQFCGVQWKYLKCFAVKYREHCHVISVDDKAIIPVGEPNLPVSTNVRRRNRSLVSGNSSLLALDHDYHLAGIVASILFHIIIPNDPNESFHQGLLVVGVKDKFFQPSNPQRHCAENVNLLRIESAKQMDIELDNVNDFYTPILLCLSDGGPDHNVTFFSVKLATLALFISLNLDMIISCRCAPCQSYTNPAERCMSVLNIPLQGVALERSEMSAVCENAMHHVNTLKDVRKSAQRNQTLKEALEESMKEPIDIVVGRFRRSMYCALHTQAYVGVTEDTISDVLRALGIFSEDEFNFEHMKNKPREYPKLIEFMEFHCRSRTYSFQIKKCTRDNCWFCLMNPIRMSDDEFQNLNWLPDPQKDENGNWDQFENLYGQPTTDDQRPSIKDKPTSQNDDRNKKLFCAAKVRAFIICLECGKRRCVYAACRLSHENEVVLEQLKDDLIYTCGETLFHSGHDLHAIIVVREAVNCSFPIEASYSSGVKDAENICCHCGDNFVLSRDDCPDLEIFHSQFSSVQPICSVCWEMGKRPKTRSRMK